jgi:hypothetical protein
MDQFRPTSGSRKFLTQAMLYYRIRKRELEKARRRGYPNNPEYLLNAFGKEAGFLK